MNRRLLGSHLFHDACGDVGSLLPGSDRPSRNQITPVCASSIAARGTPPSGAARSRPKRPGGLQGPDPLPCAIISMAPGDTLDALSPADEGRGGAMQITRNSLGTTVGPSEWFTGAVYLDPVAAPSGPSRLSATNVHFTPSARTAWHTHPNGQTIYVTEGVALV